MSDPDPSLPDTRDCTTERETSKSYLSCSEVDSVGRMVDALYFSSSDGDSAVVTCPNTPAIYLTHLPHQQVRWRTEGRKGLTIPLEDARERMAMVFGTKRTKNSYTLVGRSRGSTIRTFS